MSVHPKKVSEQLAFVLHSHPYRETSLILDVFSRHYGRFSVVARGARRPRSAVRSVLMSFQPLMLSWFGKHELKTLHSAEWQGGQPYLQGTALMCGFYLNELMLNLLGRDDPHEQLFDYYQATLLRLAHETDFAATLRCFEKHLFQELGYALPLKYEVDGHTAIKAEQSYCFIMERGAVPAVEASEQGVMIQGKTLLDMADDIYIDPQTNKQSKLLMRMLLNHYLAGKTLFTRELIKDIQKR